MKSQHSIALLCIILLAVLAISSVQFSSKKQLSYQDPNTPVAEQTTVTATNQRYTVPQTAAETQTAQPNGNTTAELSGTQNNTTDTIARTRPRGTGPQTIRMRVTPEEYIPDYFRVRAGDSITLIINGDEATGCTEYVMSSKLGFSRKLVPGDNVINIPPLRNGTYLFSCGMAMVFGTIVAQ